MMRRKKAEAWIAREADGTLPQANRQELATALEASPELAGELELQGQALSLMRGLDAEQAPPELHASVQSMVAARPAAAAPARRSWRLAPVLAMAVLVIALAAVLLSGGSSSTPTVSQAALLALREPTQPAPRESTDGHATLQRGVDGISFPYWRHTLGWSSTGARSDNFAGHAATTVFYAGPNASSGNATVGYTILSGDALPLPKGTPIEHRGVRYYVLHDHGATVVTWRREGHTCILAARGVAPGTLLHLAAWA